MQTIDQLLSPKQTTYLLFIDYKFVRAESGLAHRHLETLYKFQASDSTQDEHIFTVLYPSSQIAFSQEYHKTTPGQAWHGRMFKHLPGIDNPGDIASYDTLLARSQEVTKSPEATADKKTTVANYRRMKTVRWENGHPIKRDGAGNLWRFGRNYGVACCTLKLVEGVVAPNEPKIKLQDMGTTGLVQWVVSGGPRRLFGARCKRASNVIARRYRTHGTVEAFKRACNDAWDRFYSND